MIRWGISALLLACVFSHGQTLQGKVTNRIEQPLKGAKVCLLGFADRCTSSDDSGSWSLTIPVGIRNRSGSRSDNGFFRIRTARHSLSLESSASGPLHLDWMDVRGRHLVSRGAPLPSRLSGSLRLSQEILGSLPEGMILLRARHGLVQKTIAFIHMRGEAMEIQRFDAEPLAKSGYYLPYYLEASLAGYETEFEMAVEPTDISWLNLTPLGEKRDHRSYGVTLPVLSINREEHYVEVRNSYFICDSGKKVERASNVKLPFYLHEGRLYHTRSGDSCRANRFTGNGADIPGTWIGDDLYAEMPAPYRPAGCPSVLPFSRPTDPGTTHTYRISNSELSLEFSGPSCLSDERWYPARNLIMFNDRSVRWVENSCRRTAWVNSAGDSAFQTFEIHGGLDSAKVAFTYKDKTCSYIDDGQFSDPPPSCPDPVEAAQEAYLECIAASGFAKIPRILRKPADVKRGTKQPIPLPAPW